MSWLFFTFIIRIIRLFLDRCPSLFKFKACDIWFPGAPFTPSGSHVTKTHLLEEFWNWFFHLRGLGFCKLQFIQLFWVKGRSPFIIINKISIFRSSLLGKGFIGESVIGSNHLGVYHPWKFYKLRIFYVFFHLPNPDRRVFWSLPDTGSISQIIRIWCYRSIQYICISKNGRLKFSDISTCKLFQFDVFHLGQCNFQIIICVQHHSNHCCDKYLRERRFQFGKDQ